MLFVPFNKFNMREKPFPVDPLAFYVSSKMNHLSPLSVEQSTWRQARAEPRYELEQEVALHGACPAERNPAKKATQTGC